MNIKFLARVKFACVAVLLLAALTAHAQFRASIQGTVTDPDGAVVPNAKLELKDNATNQVQNATSDASGVYNFNALPADAFTLTTTAAGFKQNVIQNLHVIPEQPNSVDVKLALGESSTTVTASQASWSRQSTRKRIEHWRHHKQQRYPASLPSLFNRDVFTLTQLAPGA